jgi:ABC-type polysaccharide/polyol phosphate export permease
MNPIFDIFRPGWMDIAAALRKLHLASTMARQEISTRYKRSRIGAFWITIGMAISIACIGMIF